MKTKLLKIFNDLGWIHEEEGKVTVWEQIEFDPTELSKNIRNFKNICLEEFEDCTIEIEDVKWDIETQTYTMDYKIVNDRIYELRKILEELRHHYNQDNLVNEYESKTSGNFTLEINIFKEINLIFICRKYYKTYRRKHTARGFCGSGIKRGQRTSRTNI